MSTPRNGLAVLAILTCVPSTTCTAAEQQPKPGKIDLRILYFGRPGSERQKDFAGFLARHFEEVQTGNLKRFHVRRTRGSDVIILDWDENDFKAPRPTMPEDYARPTVTVGVPGANLCSRLRLKTGYL